MKVLISEKLSEHKYKTPEGYLICTDAILARTGKQSYTKDELFQDGDNTEVNVDRPYDEVMNAKTIASFENKPITFDHPDEDVNVGNYKDYAIGYVRDVHQGKTDKGEDVILGNLVITDQDAINAIEQGDHTDLSCGYDCDIRDDGDGNYSQTNIRGNHLALCEQGRAGIARIVDSKINDSLSHADVEQIEKAIRAHLHYVPGALTSKHIEYVLFAYTDLPAEKIKEFVRGHGIRSIKEMGWLDSKVEDEMNYSKEMKAVRNALRHIVVDNKSEMKQLIQDLIDNKPMNYSLEVRRLKHAIDELIKWSDNRQEGIDTIWAIAKENRIVDSKINDKLSYEAASSDDNYLDEVEKMIYKFANVRVDAMLVGDKLKIAARNSKGFNSKQLNDIASVLMKNVAVSNITISNPDKFDSNVTAKIVDSKIEDDNLDKVVSMLYRYGYKFDIKSVGGRRHKITPTEGQDFDKLLEAFDDNGYELLPGKGEQYFYIVETNVKDSKVEDVNYSEKEIKEAAMKLLKQKPFLTYEEALQKVKENIRNGNYLLDNEIEDSKLNYDTLKEIKSDIYYAMKGYWQTVFADEWFDENAFSLEQDHFDEKILILRFKIRKEAYFRTEPDFEKFKERLKTIPDLKLKKIHKKSVKVPYHDNDKFIQVDEITFQYIGQMTDSKEMTMSDAIKMLNIVDAYKKAKTSAKDSYIVVRNKSKYEDAARKLGLTIEKDSKSLRIYGDKYKLKQLQNQFDNDEEISYVVIKDASKNEWVIKNTGLAYEIWNQGKMVKKFPTKKLAIEWIHSRFPTDEITEDSTKDGRLWQTLTRKAKH